MSLEQRHAVVAEAKTWLGTPYHHRARVKGVGVDCAMLPAEVYEACGCIPRVNPKDYPTDWHLHRSEERYLQTVLEHAKETDRIGVGDFVLYKWGRCFSHGAIVVQWPLIIHAVTDQAVLLANGNSGKLENREFRAYTLWEE